MKKSILAVVLAIASLGITSCNKDVEPIVYPDECVLTVEIADLMTNGLFNVFSYVEYTSAKIANGETLPASITVNRDDNDSIVSWSSNFNDETGYLRGEIKVDVNGSLLANGTIKTVDCSKIILNVGNTLKFFDTIRITNLPASGDQIFRTVTTNQFGWGKTTNDVSLNANYEFKYKLNPSKNISECIISGSATGNHFYYGGFLQDISTALNVGGYCYFTEGAMTIYTNPLPEIEIASIIEATFTAQGIYGTYNGITFTYP
ncbi:MAG: hypothetical protein LBQ28_00215 [Prevotellaceae bacterium]|nr:hypothetical protein [Prevotellaceae bacterium]